MNARIGLALSLTLASTALVSAEPFRHSTGEWREYNRDWLAACPDVIDDDATDYYGFSCFASTGSAELNSANLPAYKLTVLLNRLNGEIDLAVTVAADGVETDTSGRLGIGFGGEPEQQFNFTTDLETRHNTVNQFFVVDPARRDELLQRIKERNAVTLTVPLTGGAETSKIVRLSLRGVTASIDFMTTYARRVAQY